MESIAAWDGKVWSTVGSPAAEGKAIARTRVIDHGSGPALYAVGDFQTIGAVAANDIARWDGKAWSPVGDGISVPDSLLLDAVYFENAVDSGLFGGGTVAGFSGTASVGAVRYWCVCADLTGDGFVGQDDLAALLAAYGASAGGDIDKDGDTDQADLGVLLQQYGTACEP
ncbi:MAG TPA: hypothetical protein VNI78_13270 [Vicinamibacterales bacterium]|nr:hypothetical protein [Vicinamibacterales bacterium]